MIYTNGTPIMLPAFQAIDEFCAKEKGIKHRKFFRVLAAEPLFLFASVLSTIDTIVKAAFFLLSAPFCLIKNDQTSATWTLLKDSFAMTRAGYYCSSVGILKHLWYSRL